MFRIAALFLKYIHSHSFDCPGVYLFLIGWISIRPQRIQELYSSQIPSHTHLALVDELVLSLNNATIVIVEHVLEVIHQRTSSVLAPQL